MIDVGPNEGSKFEPLSIREKPSWRHCTCKRWTFAEPCCVAYRPI